MSEAFRETNTKTYRNIVTFISGFGVVADQEFQVGSPTTTNSKLITYNLTIPWGGISGYLSSGELEHSDMFVKTTGAQTINGLKTFNNGIETDLVDSITSNGSIDLSTLRLKDASDILSLGWNSRRLSDSVPATSLDWNSRFLSGTWTVDALRMSGVSVATGQGGGGSIDLGAYQPVFITGNQNIHGLKVFSGAIFSGYFSGTSLTGYNVSVLNRLEISGHSVITGLPADLGSLNIVYTTGDQTIAGTKTFSTNVKTDLVSASSNNNAFDLSISRIKDTSDILSINWTSRRLSNNTPTTTLDWQAKNLIGNWTGVGEFDVTTSLKISGQSVITGGSFYSKNNESGFITSGEYYRPTQLYSGFNPINIDWSSGNVFKFMLTGNVNFNFTNHRDGQTIVVGVSNTGTGWYTGVFPNEVHWPSNIVPIQSSGSKMDAYTFIKITTGFYGSVVQGFSN